MIVDDCPSPERLQDLLAERLSEIEAHALEEHVETCPGCQLVLEELTAADTPLAGDKPPEREELDDRDESTWEKGLDGRASDPWVYQYLVPFERANGELDVFVTSSFGGRRAIADLCNAYGRRARNNSGQPLIKLGVVEMMTKKFGAVPRPNFEIVGWVGGVELKRDMPAGLAAAQSVDMRRELDDEIPF